MYLYTNVAVTCYSDVTYIFKEILVFGASRSTSDKQTNKQKIEKRRKMEIFRARVSKWSRRRRKEPKRNANYYYIIFNQFVAHIYLSIFMFFYAKLYRTIQFEQVAKPLSTTRNCNNEDWILWWPLFFNILAFQSSGLGWLTSFHFHWGKKKRIQPKTSLEIPFARNTFWCLISLKLAFKRTYSVAILKFTFFFHYFQLEFINMRQADRK